MLLFPSNSQFPDENIDPRLKTKPEFMLQYSIAALYSYSLLPEGAIGRRSKLRYERNMSYAMGRQDIAPYKAIFNNGDNNIASLLVTDWSVMPIIPNLMRVALARTSNKYDVQIDPIDTLARSELQDEIARMKAKIAVRESLMQNEETAEIAANSLVLAPEPNEPEDWDGIQIAELGIRHKTAMEVEMLAETIFNGNSFQQIQAQYKRDLFAYGVCFVKDETIGMERIGIRRCDPRSMVMNFCQYPDFKDWRYIGEVVSMPVSQLIVMSQGELNEDDIRLIYEMGNNNQKYNSYNEFAANGSVEVLDLEFRSVDVTYHEDRETAAGNPSAGKVDYNKGKKGNGKYKERKIENIYCCKYILGTQKVFQCGKKNFQKRNQTQKSLVKSSYHIGVCDFFEMRVRSRAEELIVHADAIQLAIYRLQHTLNTVVPKGYFINYDALEAVSLSAGGERQITPKEILTMFFQRGILIGRYSTLDGDSKPMKAIESLDSGVGNEIAEYWTLINSHLEMMRQALGLNDATDGSTINPKNLNSTNAAMIESTNNALSDIIDEDRKIAKSLTESVVIRAQDVLKHGDKELFVSVLGDTTLLERIKDITQYIYGVEIVENPSEQEVASIQMQLGIAQQNKEVTISDVFMLDNIKNIKQKQLFLSYTVKKNIERQKQEALAQQQQTGQIQVQSAQAAEQFKQQTAQMLIQLEMQKIQMEKDLELRNLEVGKQYDLERERIAASGRVESSTVQAVERAESNTRTNTTKLIADDKDDKIDKINIPSLLNSRVAPQTASGNPLEVKPQFEFFTEEETPHEASETPQFEQQEEMNEAQGLPEEANEPVEIQEM